VSIQTLHADFTISMSEFKKNPSKAASEEVGRPIAVLNRNKPAFYVVPPDLFEAMLDELDEARIAPIVKTRLRTNKRVKVDLNQL
jgi:antitoxin StbD